MRVLLIIVMCITFSSAMGQYIDIPGKIARSIEKNDVKKMRDQAKRVTTAYTKTVPTTLVEKTSVTRLNFNSSNAAYINYFDYSTMCDSYLNPWSRIDCKNKYNYLKQAHMTVLNLVRVNTTNPINRGVKEQITEKYNSITNNIYKELEMMKYEAQKNLFYRILSR